MIEAQLRQRLELQQAHQDYLELKAKKLVAQKEEDERFRQQVYKILPIITFRNYLSCSHKMMAKFAEDDRIEQLSAQKRRMKQLEHRRAVERLIEERRAQFQRQKVQLVCTYYIVIDRCNVWCRRWNCLIDKRRREWNQYATPLLNKNVRNYSRSMQLSFWVIFQKLVLY